VNLLLAVVEEEAVVLGAGRDQMQWTHVDAVDLKDQELNE
jgi:hypothetical protein